MQKEVLKLILLSVMTNNEFTGNAGNDSITGGAGDDTAVYSGVKANYTITNNGDGTYSVRDDVGSEGTDTLTTMEFAEFWMKSVTLATGASSASIILQRLNPISRRLIVQL